MLHRIYCGAGAATRCQHVHGTELLSKDALRAVGDATSFPLSSKVDLPRCILEGQEKELGI